MFNIKNKPIKWSHILDKGQPALLHANTNKLNKLSDPLTALILTFFVGGLGRQQ